MRSVARSSPARRHASADQRETLVNERRVEMAIDRYTARPVRSASRTIARATRSRDARSPAGSYPRHEPLAIRIDAAGALAAQRFGQQKSRLPGNVQRGRMKLDELEIGDARAGAIGHRHAVAGRDAADSSSRETPAPRRRSRAASRDARAPPSVPSSAT